MYETNTFKKTPFHLWNTKHTRICFSIHTLQVSAIMTIFMDQMFMKLIIMLKLKKNSFYSKHFSLQRLTRSMCKLTYIGNLTWHAVLDHDASAKVTCCNRLGCVMNENHLSTMHDTF